MNTKVLIFENQFTQYKAIRSKLEKKKEGLDEFIEVYPKPDEYEKFITWVCIVLNPSYFHAKRTKSLVDLKEYIEARQIEVFIIDYQLVSSYGRNDGISLAVDLVTKDFKGVPIIFLSATSPNPVIEGDLDAVRKRTTCVWVEKGYAGISLNLTSFVQVNLIDNIKKLLDRSVTDDYTTKLKELMSVKQFSHKSVHFEEWLGILQRRATLDQPSRNKINILHLNKDHSMDPDKIEEIFNQ